MAHLSARIAWHDNGWNGCVCLAPHLNSSCIVQEQIRDERDDKKEKELAGLPIHELGGWKPPCSRDIGAYSSFPCNQSHNDPLHRKYLSKTQEIIPPYSVLPAPYRWVREEHFQDICEKYNLKIRGAENINKTVGWVYEPDRQVALLDAFWSKIAEEKGHSLIFYYSNQGNPVDENSIRLIVGIGRIADISKQLYFGGKDDKGNLYPIWTRVVTQDFPAQGFRLPYQEYLQAGHDPKAIACLVPKDLLLNFSYVGELVTDDQAIGIIERLIQSVKQIKQDGIVDGNWDKQLSWLNDCLDEVWLGRGAYPGLGSVLEYLKFRSGTTFQRFYLRHLAAKNQNPLDYVISVLEGKIQPHPDYMEDFKEAMMSWRAFGKKPVRQELLKLLTKFDLTKEQVTRISDPELRYKAGINKTEEELLNNPYLIFELDLGSEQSQPVSLESIDRGMVPDISIAHIIPTEEIYSPEDNRRIRGIAVSVLKEAANLGDTVFSITDFLSRVREKYPDKRACRPDIDVFLGDVDFYQEQLWLSIESNPQLVSLRYLRVLENKIAETIERRSKRSVQNIQNIDWRSALVNKFGEPQSDRENEAIEEKTKALETIYTHKLSILTGSAGTGKTTTLKVFLDEIEKVEGKQGLLLLAPTGKARVRLASSTRRMANTIHQILFNLDWIEHDTFTLKLDGGGITTAPVIIIDECSMVPVDLFGTLFKAVNMGAVQRLILVGDPNQLPPIGPGRPFVDLIAWLEVNNPECIANLATTMRTSEEAELTEGSSTALSFAESYRNEGRTPTDDELLSLIAQNKIRGDMEVHFWNTDDELNTILRDQMEKLFGIQHGNYNSFGQSFGITKEPWKQDNWNASENWQILTPVHAHPYGTESLNRDIQQTYKKGLIEKAQAPWENIPSPFGDRQIVYTDKVIQIMNRRMKAWPQDKKPLNYVANGEIGIVTTTHKGDNGEYLQVGFSTQNGVTYRYYRSQVDENLDLAYALTVHKAQGSDFDYVFLIIPKEAPTLSRELIYTGLTRYRKKLILLIEKDIETLRELRQPERSDTLQRNTNLFNVSIRPEQQGRFYPEALIHRTSAGIAVRSKSEVIVADALTSAGLIYQYEEPLVNKRDPRDFRLPDFKIGFEGDIFYWEHLGMLGLPSYKQKWENKRRWYEDVMHIPVIDDYSAAEGKIKPGTSPIVLTSHDEVDGGILVPQILDIIKKYILLE